MRPTDPAPKHLARQMAGGFAAVSIVAIGMCALLLGAIHGVSGMIAHMRGNEESVRQGLGLATAVRELSIHIAHTVIEPDGSHLEHYETWRDRVRLRIQELSPAIPDSERGRLEALGQSTQRMHDLLMTDALPAARRGDTQTTKRVHRLLDVLGQQAARDADALAQVPSTQMAHVHDDATQLTQAALIGGGLCVALVVGLSIGFTLRLRAAFLRPLQVLTEAAGRFGRGDFEHRVGTVGKGELAALAAAFDRMVEELKTREAALVRQERMAAIGQLAAGVAHELNNPIAIIRGYLKTMSPEGDAQTLREELAILDEEASQCQRIAQDLLSYARTEDLTITPVVMPAFIQESASRFGESPVGTGRRVQVDAQRAVVDVDGDRLRQVLLNLLNNAGQAAPDGTALAIRGHRHGDWYHIEVEDQGSGVAEADHAHVFEPFFSKRNDGSGLGLAVCLGIVKAHGGEIQVASADHGGAVFIVRLPVRQPNAQQAATTDRTEASG